MANGVADKLGQRLGPSGQVLAGRALRRNKIQERQPVATPSGTEQTETEAVQMAEQTLGRSLRNQARARDNADERIAESLVSEDTLMDASSLGENIGQYLRAEIESGKFSGFIMVLGLSIFKDLADFTDGGFVWVWIVGPIVTIAVTTIFFMQSSRFKRWLLRKYVWKYVAWIFIGFIPILNIMPEMTIAAILLKLKVDKRIRRLETELGEVERRTNQ
ncbi:MAG: hypothetical protein Q8Q23_04925 [bacterium]|nr:hypothetical protein [bacterium]